MSTPVIHAAFRKGDVGIEIRTFGIAKTGKGKARRRTQTSLADCPTIWLDGYTDEHAEILFDELRKACRAFVQRVKAEAPKEAAVPVDLAALQREHDRASAAARDEIQRKVADVILGTATVQTGETGTTQTIEPVFEVRPARAVQDLSGPPMVRTEADELAEGMRLAGLA